MRTPVKVTAAGVVGIVAGTAIAWEGAQPLASFNQILAGAVVAELGFVLCTPVLVGACGHSRAGCR